MEPTVIIVLIVVALVVIGGWLLTRRSTPVTRSAGESSKRKAELQPKEEAEKEITAPSRPTGVYPTQSLLDEQVLEDSIKPASPPAPRPRPMEDVHFTAFHPKEVSVEMWYTLLVYAHIEAVLSQVQADAARFKQEMGGETPRQRQVSSSTPVKLARGTEITIVPLCEGVTFNPPRITFQWVEDFHRAEFRFNALKTLAGEARNGLIMIYIGPLIVATLKLSMLFEEAAPTSLKMPQTTEVRGSLYKQERIFASYSHTDTSIVLACRDAYKALGYDILIDIDSLRSGENWNAALMELIDHADIFQMFWSARYARSKHCRLEWEYALKKAQDKDGGFIRPVYWEKPLPPPPDELAALHFAYVPLGKSETQPAD